MAQRVKRWGDKVVPAGNVQVHLYDDGDGKVHFQDLDREYYLDRLGVQLLGKLVSGGLQVEAACEHMLAYYRMPVIRRGLVNF